MKLTTFKTIEHLVKEAATTSGLHPLVLHATGNALTVDEGSDTYSARFVVKFETPFVSESTRPIVKATIDGAALTLGDPELAALIKAMVATAKSEMLQQLRSAIALLESCP